MRAGRLRHRITLQAPIGTPNSYGEDEPSWQTFAESVPADIRPLQGREYDAAKQRNAETTHSITIRYRQGVLQTMRVVFGERIFRIEEILNRDERNRELTIRAVEVTAG